MKMLRKYRDVFVILLNISKMYGNIKKNIEIILLWNKANNIIVSLCLYNMYIYKKY